MDFLGVVKDVTRRSEGENRRGPWSVQGITIKDFNGGRDVRVSVWNRPDMINLKGKKVKLTGVVEGKDRDGNPQKEMKEGESSIEEIEDKTDPAPTRPASPAKAAPTVHDRPTQSEYEAVLSRAIVFATGEMKRASSPLAANQSADQRAVAEIVKGYMVAFSKGDFVVEVDDKDIPF